MNSRLNNNISLAYQISGQGPYTLVLIHGMAASHHYWDQFLPYIPNTYQIIMIDLLGFGNSPKPKNTTYNLKNHCDPIIELLNRLKIKDMTIIGHSMGAIISLELARQMGQGVKKLVLIGLPWFISAQEARRAITKGKTLNMLSFYGPTSWALCNLWCRLGRPLTKHLTKLYLPKLSKTAAQDSLKHTWQSYNSSRRWIIENQNLKSIFDVLKIPIILIYGQNENPIILKNIVVQNFNENVRIEKLSNAGHQVVLEQPAKLAKLIF